MFILFKTRDNLFFAVWKFLSWIFIFFQGPDSLLNDFAFIVLDIFTIWPSIMEITKFHYWIFNINFTAKSLQQPIQKESLIDAYDFIEMWLVKWIPIFKLFVKRMNLVECYSGPSTNQMFDFIKFMENVSWMGIDHAWFNRDIFQYFESRWVDIQSSGE